MNFIGVAVENIKADYLLCYKWMCLMLSWTHSSGVKSQNVGCFMTDPVRTPSTPKSYSSTHAPTQHHYILFCSFEKSYSVTDN